MPRFVHTNGVEVEAVKFTGWDGAPASWGPLFRHTTPDWFWEGWKLGKKKPGGIWRYKDTLMFNSAHGERVAWPGDWVIRDPDGMIFPQSERMFNHAYQEAA